MTLLNFIEKADVENVEEVLASISTKTLNEVQRDRAGNPYTFLDKAMDLVESGPSQRKVSARAIVKLLVNRGALTSRNAMRPAPLKRKTSKSKSTGSRKNGRPPLHRVVNMRSVKNGIAAKHNARRTVKAKASK